MNSVSASLNYLLAANGSEFARPTYGATTTTFEGKPASDLRASLGALKPGTTVSARYDYTVDRQGQLVPSGTTITTGDPARPSRGFLVPDERPQRFADLLKPKPNLEPADEVQLFASTEEEGGSANRYVADGAIDENGDAVEVEIIAPSAQPASPLIQQRQQQASTVYARNNELIYTSDPVFAFAA